MNRVLRVAACIYAVCQVASAHAGAPSAEVFGNLPLAESGSLSPDGKHLAMIQPVRGRDGVMIYDLATPNSKPYALIQEGAVAENAFWKSNDRLIVTFMAHMKQEWSPDVFGWRRAVSVDATGDKAVTLLHGSSFLRRNFGTDIVDRAPQDPTHVYIAAWETNAEMSGSAPLVHDQYYLNLFKVDVLDGSKELVLHGSPNTVQFVTDGTGHVVGRVDEDSDLEDHVFIGNTEVMSYQTRGGTGAEVVGLTQDGEGLALVSADESGMTTLTASYAGTRKTLFADPQYSLAEPLADERTGRVIGAAYYDDMLRNRYFDPAMQNLQTSLEKAFPGQSVEILSRDESGTSCVIMTNGPQHPPVLSLYTRSNHQVNILQEAYPDLKPGDLGTVRPYPYKAGDGLAIHAYLTLPPGKPPHNLPTVIFPHGGPEDRDSMNFDWWAQFMATRGYAVLQPNYRGSSGYGSDFMKAGDGEWAGKAQQDLRDGVNKLIADGIADPKRICIVGASWGGYMALAGVTFEPDLYACAISYGGPSDLAGYTLGSDSDVESVWRRRIGEKPREQSPARFAEHVQAPVLLIHSEKDAVVPIKQSRMEEDALKSAGKQVELVVLDGEDHFLEFADTRTKMLQEIDRFLDAHIGEHRGGDKAIGAKQPDSAPSHA